MIRIEVADDSRVETRSGMSAKNKPYTIHEQSVWAHVIDESGKPAKYPVKARVNIEDPDKPYRQGFYQLDPRSVHVDQYGAIGIARPRLVPIAQSAASPKSA